MSTNKNELSVQPYLFFDGRTEEAIEFYGKALGAEVVHMMRFKDNPEPDKGGCNPPGTENKIMHAHVRIGDAHIMLSDGRCDGKAAFAGFSLTIRVPDVAAANKFFTALSDGGKVQMPLTKTFFSESFGMVADRFGVLWMVMVGSA